MNIIKPISCIFTVAFCIVGCEVKTYLSHNDIAKMISSDSTQSLTVLHGLKLGESISVNQDIIESDSTAYPLSSTYYYKERIAKPFERDRDAIYDILGYGDAKFYLGHSQAESMYGDEVDFLLKSLRDAPPSASLFLDYFLDSSYRCSLVINYDKDGQTIFDEIEGWFSYESYNDTVFVVNGIFDINPWDAINYPDITIGIKNLLSEKYGNPNSLMPYFGDKNYISTFDLDTARISDSYYKPLKTNRRLNIVDSYFWIVGRYEIQLYINEVKFNQKTMYECIIRYIDNKMLGMNIDYLNLLIKNSASLDKVEKQKIQDEYKKQQSNQEI